MINKLISFLLFAIWFKLYNVLFYSYFDIPVEFVIGAGMNWFKVYWLGFFVVITVLAYNGMRFFYKLSSRRIDQTER